MALATWSSYALEPRVGATWLFALACVELIPWREPRSIHFARLLLVAGMGVLAVRAEELSPYALASIPALWRLGRALGPAALSTTRASSIVMLLGAAAYFGTRDPRWPFVAGTLASVVEATDVLLRRDRQRPVRVIRDALATAAGAALLVRLALEVPLAECWRVWVEGGPMLAFAGLTPLTWALANAESVRCMLPVAAARTHLLFVQLVGDALNNVVPAAGVGGEPLKAVELGRYAPLGTVGSIVVQNRVAQAVGNAVVTAIAAGSGALLLAVDADVRLGYAFTAVAYVIVAASLSALLLSSTMHGWAARVTRRFGLSEGYRLQRNVWTSLLGWKLVVPALKCADIVLFGWLSGSVVGVVEAGLVYVSISVTSAVFFFVPQGLGANEAGIAATFALLGLPPEVGLAYALTRRARVAAWTALGFGLLSARGLRRELPRPTGTGLHTAPPSVGE